jgi:hypothetical protein
MRRADFLAGSIATGLTKDFCAKIDDTIRWAFASALGIDLLAAPADDDPFAAFTADRAQLLARLKEPINVSNVPFLIFSARLFPL